MKNTFGIVCVVLVLIIGLTIPGHAIERGGYKGKGYYRGSSGYHGGGYKGRSYYRGSYHRSNWHGSIWIGPGWGGWRPWWGPAYYPEYYPYYPYYPERPVIIQQDPSVYTQPDEPYYWYYCQNPEGYYPYIKKCPDGWLKVVPPSPPDEKE